VSDGVHWRKTWCCTRGCGGDWNGCEGMEVPLGLYRKSCEGAMEAIGKCCWSFPNPDACKNQDGGDSALGKSTVTARADSVRPQLEIHCKHLPPLCLAQAWRGVGAEREGIHGPRSLGLRECGPMTMHNPREFLLSSS
jgi:hypothetical protein